MNVRKWNFFYSAAILTLSLAAYACTKSQVDSKSAQVSSGESPVSTGPVSDRLPVPSISPREAEGLLRNDFAVLIDVREKDEIAEGMAARGEWFPLSKAESSQPADQAEFKSFLAKLPKDKKIILYCRSGNRSGKFAAILEAQGFKTANMGGFEDWKAAGLPIKKP